MGGEIGFAVRYRDGDEVKQTIMNRWTNDLFWRIATPSFIEGGKELHDLVAEARPENKWPDAVLVDKLDPSEYGVVLVDFISRTIYSRNNYSTPMKFSVSGCSTAFPEELAAAIEHLRAGNVDSIGDMFGNTVSVRGRTPDESLCDDVNKLRRKFYARIILRQDKPELFRVVVDDDKDKLTKADVEAYLKSVDWNLPIDPDFDNAD